MSTRKIEPRGRKPSKNQMATLTEQQQAFVEYLLASKLFKPTDAARKAGYKNPGSAIHKLLENPLIQMALGRAKRDRQERCKLQADRVLRFIKTALFFNPFDYFKVYGDRWCIEDPKKLPRRIARLVTKVRAKNIELPTGTKIKTFEVEFIDKRFILDLAAKHCNLVGAGDQTINITNINWDGMYKRPEQSLSADRIEQRIQNPGLPTPPPDNVMDAEYTVRELVEEEQ